MIGSTMHSLGLLDAAVRFVAFGILALIAVLLLRDGPRRWTGYAGAAFSASAASYLLCSFGPARESAGAFLPLLQAACLTVPYFLWATALAIFGDLERLRWFHALPMAALLASGFASILSQGETWATATVLVHHAVVIGLCGHALATAWRGLADDLVEGRRKFRGLFIGMVALFGVVIALTEVLHSGEAVSAYLEFAGAGVILALVVAFALFALRLIPDRLFLAAPTESDAPASSARAELGPADRTALALILKAIESDRLYRREGLTISVLAQTIKIPEHHIRRVINAGLGYRNFNAFLNRYRIEDIKLALADPSKARIPILTIALDTGYNSLAPFNRAFRDMVGMTPSAYRKAKIGAASESEQSAG